MEDVVGWKRLDGRRKMEDVEGAMEDGRWKMEDVILDGRWKRDEGD